MPDPHRWGVDTGYYDALGQWHDVPASTIVVTPVRNENASGHTEFDREAADVTGVPL